MGWAPDPEAVTKDGEAVGLMLARKLLLEPLVGL